MRGFFSVLTLVAACLVLVGWLVLGRGTREPLVPDLENVAQSFVQALSAGRYEAARQQLSDNLRARMGSEALRSLDRALKAKYGGYRFELGGQEQRQQNGATFQAWIATESGETLRPAFDLEGNLVAGLWEIGGLDELVAAAQA